MGRYFRVRAEIRQDALRGNIRRIRSAIGEETLLMAVIKSNAYGHGIEHVVPVMEEEKVDQYAVASVGEGLQVRKLTEKPVLVLGYTDPDDYRDALSAGIDLTIFSLEQAQILSEVCEKTEKKARIHIKIETGMERIGFEPGIVTAEFIRKISLLPGIEIAGFFSHFARSDEKDKSAAEKQLKKMTDFLDVLQKRGVRIPLMHIANSAAIMEFPESYRDLPYPVMVRAGIMLYGLYPSDEMDKEAFILDPVMELKSHIVHLKWVDQGTPIGYGGSYVTDRRMHIATIPVGYGDGYPRHLSNVGEVLIRGMKAPIRGRVCMDQLMVDVTDIPGVRLRDEVELFGRDLLLEEVAEKAGTIHYEIICQLTDRVERVGAQTSEEE
ncbi:MAG: alanine racemase [Firmicutes bacterium]|nr:alanine racemase [Bacillota bacterium]